MEGYACTGHSEGARLLGEVGARNFQEACDKVGDTQEYYDRTTRTVWSCKLFDNEADARKNFG